MKNLKRKLRSNRGASITFALLIFLVCAIVSGVVIVAASTAGGRMSGMKETDQRYFAATAAAHTLQEIFDGQTVVITYNKIGDTYTLVSAVNNSDGSAITDDILKNACWAVVTDANYEKKSWSAANVVSDTEVYTCTVEQQPTKGTLEFIISAVGGSNLNKGTYTLDILFTPNLKRPETGKSLSNVKAIVTWSLNSLSRGQASQKTGG